MISAGMIGAAALAAIGVGATSIATSATGVAAAVPCGIVDADVESGTAMFTVGPAGCTGEVGPISFSTYELPSGQLEPFAEQVLIEHSDANGSSYGAGTFTVTASLGAALNWQADLYMGDSIDQPPQPDVIAVDAQTGITAATQTTVASGPSVAALSGSQVQTLVPGQTPSDDGELPLTGSSAPLRVLTIAAGVTAAGLAMRRLVRLPHTS
jgi:hypothetical protein